MTSDHVVVESWLLICSRLGRKAAMAFWDGVAVDVFTVVGVTEPDLRRGRALAFDAHFRVIRLGPPRNRPLRLIAH